MEFGLSSVDTVEGGPVNIESRGASIASFGIRRAEDAVALLFDDEPLLLNRMLPKKPNGFSLDDVDPRVSTDERVFGAPSCFVLLPFSRSNSFLALLAPTDSRLWSVQITSNIITHARRTLKVAARFWRRAGRVTSGRFASRVVGLRNPALYLWRNTSPAKVTNLS